MKETLREIDSVKGVWGHFICDNAGKILEREMPIVFMKHLAMVGKEITQVVGLLESLSRSHNNIQLLFEDGRVMIRNLKNFTVMVFCDPNVDMATLRKKLDAVVSKISEDSKMQELLREGEWRRRKLLQKEYLDQEYGEILNQLVPEDVKPDTSV